MITFCWTVAGIPRTTVIWGQDRFCAVIDFIMIFCSDDRTIEVRNTAVYIGMFWKFETCLPERGLNWFVHVWLTESSTHSKPKKFHYIHVGIVIKQKKILSIFSPIHSCFSIIMKKGFFISFHQTNNMKIYVFFLLYQIKTSFVIWIHNRIFFLK